MARQTVLDYADETHSGAVLELVRALRDEDPPVPLFEATIAVRERFGVRISPETLRAWCDRNGISFARAEAAQ